jgi:hypothetical protein
MPTVLYNGMLAPIAPFAITGVLWYQGEQNSERGYQYRKILPLMIADWRRVFGQASMPFLVVSLPQFQHRSETPQDDAWAEARESQAMTVATTHNTCLAVTIDTGDPDNLHPKDKEPVGDRLARCALAKYYGKKVVYSGPTMTHVDRLSSNIRIRFITRRVGLSKKVPYSANSISLARTESGIVPKLVSKAIPSLYLLLWCPIPKKLGTPGHPIRSQRFSMVLVCRQGHSGPTAGQALLKVGDPTNLLL